eukprot:gene7114-4802_t
MLSEALAEAVTLAARWRRCLQKGIPCSWAAGALWDPRRKCDNCKDDEECLCFVGLALPTDAGNDVREAQPAVLARHRKHLGGDFLVTLTGLMHGWRNPLKRA